MSDDKSDKAGSWFGNPLPIVMVVLMAAGVLVKNIPLESARPTDPERVKFSATSDQDVEARLWQDPFAAVENHEKNSNQAVTLPENILMMLFAPSGIKTSDAQHSPDVLRKRIQALHMNKDDMTVLAVSVFGGSFGEAAEYRRRSRFAVVSALDFHHYHPEDADAIGYFHITLPEPNSVKLTVPFEWFEKRDKSSNVLVLWLNEDKFSTAAPLNELHHIFNGLTPDDLGGNLRVKLIGPAGSTMLVALVPKGKNTDPNQKLIPLKGGITIEAFSPSATISNCDLNTSEPSWNCFMILPPRHLNDLTPFPIVRTTVTDDVLAAALLWELWQRGVNRDPWWERIWPTLKSWFGLGNEELQPKCDDGLVLIGERDTEYGRTLLRYLKDGFSARCGTKLDGTYDMPHSDKPPVRTFSYLRGLDGVLPDLDKSGSKASTKDPSTKSKDLLAQLEDAPPEHAEGRSQFDYLRRLADEIKRLDDDKEFFAENGVKAIGIVGSDVYDKLLILQALRNRFKDRIFFTTDLDARYLHADQKDWARNLVVASNFGLALRPALQQSTLPFRDSYQTARYLATLMALEGPPIDWAVGMEHWLRPALQQSLPPYQPVKYLATLIPIKPPFDWAGKMTEWLRPQIFEIGRTEAVHLASPSILQLKKWMRNDNSKDIDDKEQAIKWDSEWTTYKSIEPVRLPRGPSSNQLLGTLTILGLCTSLVALAKGDQSGYRIRKVVYTVYRLARTKESRLKLATALILSLVLVSLMISGVWIMDASWLPKDSGEPFLWLEGVSVWPNLVVRFVSFVTMLIFWFLLLINLRQQERIISKDFKIPRPKILTLDRRRWSAALTGPYLDLTSFDKHGKSIKKKSAEEKFEVRTLWQNYLLATSWREMAGWIFSSMLLVGGLAVAAYFVFGKASFPHRGQLVVTLHTILVLFNGPLLWLVIFWIGYEPRACARFIETLIGARSLWPPVLLDHGEASTGVPSAHLDDYLNFKLIVHATQRIHRLIYLPFVGILFLVLSRSNFFDTMDFPLALVFVTGLALTYALYSAVLLRKSAEAARATAIENYETRLLTQARATDSQPPFMMASPVSAEQIKILMERIRNTREGAFAPFAQQPALQALLLPFGGYGSVQLIEFLFKL